jgi:hypothetical protein
MVIQILFVMCAEIPLTPFIDADLTEVPKHCKAASDQCNIRGGEPVL